MTTWQPAFYLTHAYDNGISMNQNKFKNHPLILHASEINELCQPLENLYNIDYFCHVNVDTKGCFSALGKKPDFATHYLESKYYNCDIHLSQTDIKTEFVIQDATCHFGKTAQLFQDCEHFGIHHLFTLLTRNEGSLDAYHFATSKKNNNINESYLKILPQLKYFISYFKKEVCANKNLNNAYQHKFTIDKEQSAYETDSKYINNKKSMMEFLHTVYHDKLHIIEQLNTCITKRELECVMWLHFGKTADEIATILNITERTVRAHINKVRSKLKCRTLFQLGEKFNQYNLLQLIELIKNSE